MLTEGVTEEEILEDFPDLIKEDTQASLLLQPNALTLQKLQSDLLGGRTTIATRAPINHSSLYAEHHRRCQ
jgi:hypothetical protein